MARKKFNRSKKRQYAKLRLAGDPVLTQKSKEIIYTAEGFEDPTLVSNILRDMMYLLSNPKTGVGLAANQAGYLSRTIIFKFYDEYVKMINPVIKDHSPEKNIAEEGCLSYPGKKRDIARFDWVEVEFIDENGEIRLGMFDDKHARVIQHEMDHLEGACQVDKINFNIFGSKK
jgi:peptide deformylase